jgi:hypothetical protein
MNVVLDGILPLLTPTALLLAVVMALLPTALASWMREALAVALATVQRPQVCLARTGLVKLEQDRLGIPMDVAAANQAWRAPPTVRPQIQRATIAESLGRRLG